MKFIRCDNCRFNVIKPRTSTCGGCIDYNRWEPGYTSHELKIKALERRLAKKRAKLEKKEKLRLARVEAKKAKRKEKEDKENIMNIVQYLRKQILYLESSDNFNIKVRKHMEQQLNAQAERIDELGKPVDFDAMFDQWKMEKESKPAKKTCNNCKHSSNHNSYSICPVVEVCDDESHWEKYIPPKEEPEYKSCMNCKHYCVNTLNNVSTCPSGCQIGRYQKWEKCIIPKEKTIRKRCSNCKYGAVHNNNIPCHENYPEVTKLCENHSQWVEYKKPVEKEDKFCSTCKYANKKNGIVESCKLSACDWEKDEPVKKEFKFGDLCPICKYHRLYEKKSIELGKCKLCREKEASEPKKTFTNKFGIKLPVEPCKRCSHVNNKDKRCQNKEESSYRNAAFTGKECVDFKEVECSDCKYSYVNNGYGLDCIKYRSGLGIEKLCSNKSEFVKK